MRGRLTDRQLDVLELALAGLTNDQIAQRLFLSPDTIKTHFRRAYARLTDPEGRRAVAALHAVAIALEAGDMVWDTERRRITRPAGRRRLPLRQGPRVEPRVRSGVEQRARPVPPGLEERFASLQALRLRAEGRDPNEGGGGGS